VRRSPLAARRLERSIHRRRARVGDITVCTRVEASNSLQALRLLMLGMVVLMGGYYAWHSRIPRKPCIAQLAELAAAKQTYALEHGLQVGDRIVIRDLLDARFKDVPHCPAGGAYVVGVVGELPTCSILTHQLPVR